METITEAVKYTFTRDELVQIARDQARHHGALTKADEEFENVKAQYKTKVTRIEADISDCTRKVSAGYEMRNVECLLLKFRPDNNHAMLVRVDNGRVIRKRKLSSDEKQPILSDKEPETYSFEADFYEDSDGDIASLVADHVPLYQEEAQKLAEAMGNEIRPTVLTEPQQAKLDIAPAAKPNVVEIDATSQNPPSNEDEKQEVGDTVVSPKIQGHRYPGSGNGCEAALVLRECEGGYQADYMIRFTVGTRDARAATFLNAPVCESEHQAISGAATACFEFCGELIANHESGNTRVTVRMRNEAQNLRNWLAQFMETQPALPMKDE